MCQDTVTWVAFLHQRSLDSSPVLKRSGFFIPATDNCWAYMEHLVHVSVPRVSASCLWVMRFLTQKRGWVPPMLMKELYLECGKNLNLRWHVFCLYFCINPWVVKLPKKNPKVSEEEGLSVIWAQIVEFRTHVLLPYIWWYSSHAFCQVMSLGCLEYPEWVVHQKNNNHINTS